MSDRDQGGLMDDKTRAAMDRLKQRAYRLGGDADAKAILAHIATLEAREVDVDALVDEIALAVARGVAHDILKAGIRRILTEALAPKPEVPVGSWWQRNGTGEIDTVVRVDGAYAHWKRGGFTAIPYVHQWLTRVNPPTPWDGE